VGGKTKGKVTNAAIGVRQREFVCDNHHANGVATNKSTTVVVAANCKVSPMA
jgi:hypothetical protein